LGELLADELADDRAVGSARDLWHHVCHHAAEIAHARRPDLRDRVVDDLLELFLGERCRHELLQHRELVLLAPRLLLSPRAAIGLRGFEPPFAFPLEHLQLLVVVERALQFLLGGAEAGEDQPQRVATVLLTGDHRLLELVLQARDQAHGSPLVWPPSTCQCRWKMVWPAPSPTVTITR